MSDEQDRVETRVLEASGKLRSGKNAACINRHERRPCLPFRAADDFDQVRMQQRLPSQNLQPDAAAADLGENGPEELQ